MQGLLQYSEGSIYNVGEDSGIYIYIVLKCISEQHTIYCGIEFSSIQYRQYNNYCKQSELF